MRFRSAVRWGAVGALLSFALAPRAAQAVDGEWPKEIDAPEGRIVMYQPQPEAFENDTLTGRAAVSVTPKGKPEPVFGVVWFESVVDIDKNTRLCHIHTTKITDASISDAKPEQQQRLAEILTRELKDRSIDLAYDRLLASLETSSSERQHAENLSTAPPVILVEDQPAFLVTIQGEPVLRDLGKTELKKVVNTPFFLVQDPTTNKFWLNGGTRWFSAPKVEGPYGQDATPPSSVTEAYQQQLQAEGTKEAPVAEEGKEDDRVPKIIVATKPTELIFIDGTPKLTALSGSDLRYVENSEDDLFVDVATQDHYVVLSGRWYRAKVVEWTVGVRPFRRAAGGVRLHPRDFAEGPRARVRRGNDPSRRCREGRADSGDRGDQTRRGEVLGDVRRGSRLQGHREHADRLRREFARRGVPDRRGLLVLQGRCLVHVVRAERSLGCGGQGAHRNSGHPPR